MGGADLEAPYGWMTDPATGERRPKKRPGRRQRAPLPPPGQTPTLEELKAAQTPSEAREDTPPGTPPKGKRKTQRAPAEIPTLRAGQIAKGVNRLYRQAGRIVRMMDYDLGTAIIVSARPRPKDEDDEDDEDAITVGEAWENLARTNPRIRAFLTRLVIGGAWGGMCRAHLPILLAIMMKESVRSRIPLFDLASAFLTDEPEHDGPPVPSNLAQMMGGLTPDDMAKAMQFAQGMMGQMIADVPRAPNTPREPTAGHVPQFVEPVNGRDHPADQG